MLFYCPLESYPERYTEQLSGEGGWFRSHWDRNNIPYTVVEGIDGSESIEYGVVLDAVRRCRHAMQQSSQLLSLAKDGKITSDDVIYFDDFWHPGIEAVAYAFHILGIKPRMYAFCFAQSVDEFDFTYPMRSWMRPFEVGIGQILDGVFVANTLLARKLRGAGIAPNSVHVVGLPFDSEAVQDMMAKEQRGTNWDVVFTSRWDEEKQPEFYVDVAMRVRELRPDTRFAATTSAPEFRSNYARGRAMLKSEEVAEVIHFIPDLDKKEYYHVLSNTRIQFNCALQDWVSFTLLEALCAGCYPIYPYFRSFKEVFHPRQQGFCYRPPLNGIRWKDSVEDAAQMIVQLLSSDELWSEQMIAARQQFLLPPHDECIGQITTMLISGSHPSYPYHPQAQSSVLSQPVTL